jgi:hypothetical protein
MVCKESCHCAHFARRCCHEDHSRLGQDVAAADPQIGIDFNDTKNTLRSAKAALLHQDFLGFGGKGENCNKLLTLGDNEADTQDRSPYSSSRRADRQGSRHGWEVDGSVEIEVLAAPARRQSKRPAIRPDMTAMRGDPRNREHGCERQQCMV